MSQYYGMTLTHVDALLHPFNFDYLLICFSSTYWPVLTLIKLGLSEVARVKLGQRESVWTNHEIIEQNSLWVISFVN